MHILFLKRTRSNRFRNGVSHFGRQSSARSRHANPAPALQFCVIVGAGTEVADDFVVEDGRRISIDGGQVTHPKRPLLTHAGGIVVLAFRNRQRLCKALIESLPKQVGQYMEASGEVHVPLGVCVLGSRLLNGFCLGPTQGLAANAPLRQWGTGGLLVAAAAELTLSALAIASNVTVRRTPADDSRDADARCCVAVL